MSLVRDSWCLQASAGGEVRTRSIPRYLEHPASCPRFLQAAGPRSRRSEGSSAPAGSAARSRLHSHSPLVPNAGGHDRFCVHGTAQTFDSTRFHSRAGTREWDAAVELPAVHSPRSEPG